MYRYYIKYCMYIYIYVCVYIHGLTWVLTMPGMHPRWSGHEVPPPCWPWNVSRGASARSGAWCPAAVAKAYGTTVFSIIYYIYNH